MVATPEAIKDNDSKLIRRGVDAACTGAYIRLGSVDALTSEAKEIADRIMGLVADQQGDVAVIALHMTLLRIIEEHLVMETVN